MIKINPRWFATLAVVAIVTGIYLSHLINDYTDKAVLADIDAGVSLGNRGASAVGNYLIKEGKLPAALADLAEKIADIPAAKVSLSPEAGEVVVTLQNPSYPAIAGKRLFFRPVIISGMVISIACHTEADEAFRKLTEDRCD